ncbi:MAG: hypothetical protein KIT58_23270, partial [Planctomycetota bacterium]|nr:hypothetical protein [Planctomycetota bacterium]
QKTVQDAIASAEKMLGARGRLLVRRSGTEPIVRVMAQAETDELVKQAVDGVLAALDAAGTVDPDDLRALRAAVLVH